MKTRNSQTRPERFRAAANCLTAVRAMTWSGLICLAGCASPAVQEPAPPATTAPSLPPAPGGNVLVKPGSQAERADRPAKVGRIPLVYIVESRAPIRVVDLATQRILAAGLVPAGAIIRVDVDGVHIGSHLNARAALEVLHEYAIYVDAAPNAESNETFTVMPRKRPKPSN